MNKPSFRMVASAVKIVTSPFTLAWMGGFRGTSGPNHHDSDPLEDRR